MVMPFRPSHPAGMVKPIHRPQATTAIHNRIDAPPASRAGSGGRLSFSQRGKSLALMK
jgi:hypothetical protein